MTRSRPRPRPPRTLALAALLLASWARPTPAQEVVDGVVATVASQPITLSEVAFEAEVRRHAARTGNPASLGRTLTAPSALDGLVARAALLRLAPPGNGDATREIARDRARRLLAAVGAPAEGKAFLRRWGLDADGLAAWLEDDVRAEAYGEGRIALSWSVTDEERRARYAEDPSRYGGLDLAGAMAAIDAEVLAERRERFERAWAAVVEEAIARADVRRTPLAETLPK